MSIIPFVPEIPSEIVHAVETGNLVVFIGAGVSAIAGLPLWSALAKGLIQSCKQLQYINEEECDLIISKITDPKKLISIAYEKFKKDNNLEEYYTIFSEKLKPKGDNLNKETKDIFTFCKRSNALVLTTNADLLLDEYFEEELIYINYSDEALASKKPGLVKIHGSLSNKDSLVFTSIEYLKRYADTDFKRFLHNLFSGNRVVLFVGYGLSEFELLEYTLGTAEREVKNNIFVLSPYFSYEKSVKESMDQYYDSLNIRQIAYCKDKKGYNQLAEVLCSWQEEIEKKTRLRPQIIEEIKRIISSESIRTEIPLLLQITSSPEIENYLFIQLRKTSNLVEWIDALIDTSLFNPDIKLKPAIEEKLSKDRTSYRCPVWHGLLLIDYALGCFDCSTISDKIISLINTTVSSILSHPQKASNFNALYSIASIVSSFNTNILGVSLFKYLLLINGNKFNDFNEFFSVLLADKTKFYEWNHDDISSTLEILFDYFVSNTKEKVDYTVAEIVLERIELICEHIKSSTVIKMIHSIEEVEKKDFLTFASVGSIEYYHYNTNYQRTTDFILFVLKEYFRTQINHQDTEIIKSMMFHSTKTINKLMIFAISHHYQKCSRLLFESDANPFDLWDIYSDLYYLIKTNNDKIDSENRENLLNWIENATFVGRTISEDYKNYLKYNIISLLADYDLRYKKRSEKYKDYNLSEEIDIDDINKSFIIGDVQWHSNAEIVNKFKQMTLREIIIYLSDTKNATRFDIYDYSDALKAFLIDNESQIYEDVTVFDLLSPIYYSTVIDAVMKIGNEGYIYNALKIIQYFLGKEQDEDNKTNLISRSFDCIAKFNIPNFNKNTQKEIYSFVINLIHTNLDLYLKTNDYLVDTDLSISLLNHWIAKGIDLLLELTSDDLANQTIQYIENLLSTPCDNVHHDFLCCVVSKSITRIFDFDREWVFSNLDKVFISENCAKSYFLFNSRIFKELYIYLLDKGFLTKIIDNKNDDTDYTVRTILYCSIDLYIRYDYDCRGIIKSLLLPEKPNYYVCFFEEISNHLKQSEQYDKSCRLLINLCNEIAKTDIRKDVSYDQALRYFAKCLALMNEVDPSLWICLQHLSAGFNHYFSDELFTALYKHFNNYKKQISEIIISLVKHSNGYFYKSEYYKRLIKLIENEKDLQKDFIELRNCLIDKGVFDIE